MSRLPPFLAELGIDDDTQALDERTLRRAYARRLKLIDIEAEPQRFQDLREALEAALRWRDWRERERQGGNDAAAPNAAAAAEAGTAPEHAEPAATPPATGFAEPEALADAVFASFHPQVATFLDRALAHDAVQHALADERLVSIDARTFFEWRVARLLAEGWQRGHEHLLAPAIELFGWDGDHARLANFGQVGALLAAALRDLSVTQGFTEAQRVAIPPVLDRIRAAAPPDPATLADEIAALQFLVQRVPNWLRIVSPVEPVNARFQMWRDRPLPPPPEPVGAAPKPWPRSTAKKAGIDLRVVFAVLLGFFWIVGHLGGGSPTAQSSDRRPSAREQDTAAARDLATRQRQVDALLETIRHPQHEPARPPSPHARPATPPAWPDPAARTQATPNLDQPWYAPDWAKDPGASGGTAPTR